MAKKLVTFEQSTARQIMSVIRESMRTARRALQLSQRAAVRGGGGRIEYALPLQTLKPGEECDAYLAPWSESNQAFEVDTRLKIKIKDVHSWAFALGTSDYSSASQLVPVIAGPAQRSHSVPAPFNLMQKAIPDADIAADDSGTFSIWANGTDTTVNVEAYVDWAHNETGVTEGYEQWIEWRPDESRWVWLGGACPPS